MGSYLEGVWGAQEPPQHWQDQPGIWAAHRCILTPVYSGAAMTWGTWQTPDPLYKTRFVGYAGACRWRHRAASAAI